MTETIKGLKRTKCCGEVRPADIGKELTLFGWAAKQRDLGSLVFIDLRDRTGVVQLAFDENTQKSVFEKAQGVHSEYVLAAVGTVRERSNKNLTIPTGEVELDVKELRILGYSEALPFTIDDNCKTGELTRLKYRYLDLRRPTLRNNIIMRHKITKAARDYFDEQGFIEIETPMLIKSTPEGARDFLVPSRIQPGKFYALPQSPQLYKQLSMVAGFDRYMQIARCFRDEDLRADRQPEFTQIDLEMSFADSEDVMEIGEGFIRRVFKDALDVDITLPLPRLTYKEAMERFGSDKPDTRYGMEICDISDCVRDVDFIVFRSALEGGGSVRAIRAENAASVYTRKVIDKLTDSAKGIGAKGMAWIKITDDGVSSSFSKFMSEEQMDAVIQKTGAKSGDAVFIIADTDNSKVLSILGALRGEVAEKLDIIPGDKYNVLWIVDFPFFDYDEELGDWVAMHHPFTAPKEDCIQYLESDKSKVVAKCYDLVLNGVELASGSVRITDPELQKKVFDMLGLSNEEAQTKFGFLTNAFKYGAPPHAGIGIGLDRLVMQMLRQETLRDVVAFPKIQNASEPMTDCPSAVDKEQLDVLGIDLKPLEEE